MKVILSRKGFDSQYGKMPSPILPDGTLLSLPIPSKIDLETKFTDICHEGQSYYDIIHTLNPHTAIKEKVWLPLRPRYQSGSKRKAIRLDTCIRSGKISFKTPPKSRSRNRRPVSLFRLVQTNRIHRWTTHL